MFQSVSVDQAQTVRLTVDGVEIRARAGDSVAAAMLLCSVHPYRTTPISASARAPFCMMGVCFECLVRIDGMGSCQGCLVTVKDGMRVETQNGRRKVQP